MENERNRRFINLIKLQINLFRHNSANGTL